MLQRIRIALIKFLAGRNSIMYRIDVRGEISISGFDAYIIKSKIDRSAKYKDILVDAPIGGNIVIDGCTLIGGDTAISKYFIK